MKGGRIALPSEYFTGENSGNYTEENADSHTPGGQQNCGDSYGPDLQVQNGGRNRSRRSNRKSSRSRRENRRSSRNRRSNKNLSRNRRSSKGSRGIRKSRKRRTSKNYSNNQN